MHQGVRFGYGAARIRKAMRLVHLPEGFLPCCSGRTSYPAVRDSMVAADPAVRRAGGARPAYPALSVMSAGYDLPGRAGSNA